MLHIVDGHVLGPRSMRVMTEGEFCASGEVDQPHCGLVWAALGRPRNRGAAVRRRRPLARSAALGVVVDLPAAQERNRRRLLETCLAVVSVGGHDAVTVRVIAHHSAVALDTLYRYFASKEHLLVGVFDVWLADLGNGLRPELDMIGDPYARLRHVVNQLCRSAHTAPLLIDALARAYAVVDFSAGSDVDAARHRLITLFADALAEPGTSAVLRWSLAELVADQWASSALAVAQQRLSAADHHRALNCTVDLLAARRHVNANVSV